LLVGFRLFACPAYSSALKMKMEAGRSSETSGNFYQTHGMTSQKIVFFSYSLNMTDFRYYVCLFNNLFIDKAQSVISINPRSKKEYCKYMGSSLSTSVVKLHLQLRAPEEKIESDLWIEDGFATFQ
jgi:hypothetical protein